MQPDVPHKNEADAKPFPILSRRSSRSGSLFVLPDEGRGHRSRRRRSGVGRAPEACSMEARRALSPVRLPRADTHLQSLRFPTRPSSSRSPRSERALTAARCNRRVPLSASLPFLWSDASGGLPLRNRDLLRAKVVSYFFLSTSDSPAANLSITVLDSGLIDRRGEGLV